MALVTFKDLCLDAQDPATLGRFWADLLGLKLHLQEGGDAYLTGPTPQHTIWVNRVPEPKTVKHRLHLDVNAPSVAEVERLGATVLDADSFRWTVMADPEGGEFCVFVREGEITERLYEIGVDTGESPEHAVRIAAWWADILGAHVVDSERGFSYVEKIPGAPFESIDFAPVPEPKTVKNRIHLDVTTTDLDALVAAGATVLRPRDDPSQQQGIEWTVLADPDGNEFCAFLEDPQS
jgi:catechol 2,3-dioxygenase-like lactoylglutathione lyase family enzyme